MPDPQDPQALAAAVGEGMYARDRAAQALGIAVDAIEPGAAVCRMTVRDDMVQGHGTCHGGVVFTLADTAFAYACNACNRVTVALGAEITFVAPAAPASTTSRSPATTARWWRCFAALRTRRAARSSRRRHLTRGSVANWLGGAGRKWPCRLDCAHERRT
jgi:phenylacetic acid degradation protein PaaD